MNFLFIKYKRGFDIPYPAGAMANYIWMKQGIVIDNFHMGIQNENFDIAILDLMMPGMNGLDVLKHIKTFIQKLITKIQLP